MRIVMMLSLWIPSALQSIQLASNFICQEIAIKPTHVRIFETDPPVVVLALTDLMGIIGTIDLPSGRFTPEIREVNLRIHGLHGMPRLMPAKIVRVTLFDVLVHQLAHRHVAGVVV